MQTARTLFLALLLALPCAALAQDRPTREDEAVGQVTEYVLSVVYDQQPRRTPFITKDGKLSVNGTVFAIDWRGISKARRAQVSAELNQSFREKGAR